jgi:enhancer of mRNA-decapping protein 3
MSFENFVNWTVSIDCGSKHGNYQGQIKSVDQINQTLTLKHAFHNGILIDEHSIVIQAKDIIDLNLLSQPGSYFQIPKIIQKKSNSEQLKAAPIANNGIKSNVSDSQSSRSRSSKSWSDEATNEDELIINQIDLLKTNQIQDKYRCDQMILQHNNGPIDYEQIQLPIPTTKKYLTDEGLVIPSVNIELRNRLFSSAEYYGYSLERRIESMGRCTSDMCLHLLGGTQRLLVKNRHQHPTIVVLACSTEVQGAYAICAGRILASKNIRIYLYFPSNSNTNQENFIENELKLFRTTQGIITNNVSDLPRSPIDLIINGLDAANNSDSVLFAKPWYRDIVQYCSRLQVSVIGVDPPLDGGAIECKYSLVPLLPLVAMSSKNVGRLYLCDLGFGQKVFQHLQIRYASPFGAKSFVALHDN